jgi:cell wall-associated NlpC family hydrolase
MTDPGEALAAAARDLIGTPFRLHGRAPTTGLDCVGLVHAAIAATGRHPVPPRGYGLRNLAIDEWLPLAEQSGLIPAAQPIHAGDVMLIALGFGQHHLVIACSADEVIHAHAGLRRVVCQPRDPDWHIHGAWRLAPSLSES